MRQSGQTFDEIADSLNEQEHLTPRGCKFRGAHAHSILKKKRIRDNRLGRELFIEAKHFKVIRT